METKKSWDLKYNVGSPVIDNQHKVLFDLISDLNNAIRAGGNMRVLDSLLGVLLNYAFQHFDTEEKYFRKHPQRIAHCMEHYHLIKQLNNFIVDFRNNRPIDDRTPSDFLENWLLEHINQYDKRFFHDETIDLGVIKGVDQLEEYEPEIKDRRHHKRIHHNQVVDGEIRVYCYNANRLKGGKASIINLSAGGLMLKSKEPHEIHDLLVISCSIGTSFKMKEKVTVRTINEDLYGVEFVSPSQETIDFLTRLYGAVHFRHHRPV
jgi:hemerythrin-like metal-binding protein